MDWGQILSETLNQFFGFQAAYFAIAAIGLNIHFGYTGLLNFGHAGFMTVGAYGMAIPLREGWPLVPSVLIGVVAAILFALLLGVPTLRLRADYLAIVTIAAAEIFRILFRATEIGPFATREYTGGSTGINGFNEAFTRLNPYPSSGMDLGIVSYTQQQAWIITVAWVIVLLSVLFVKLAINSPWGRVLKAIREDEDAARALGKNAYSVKMQSLILGGIFGAIAGMVFVLGQGSVQPTPQDLGPPKTFFIWAALILGGTGKLWGPVIGSMIFSALLQFTDLTLRQMQQNDLIPEAIMDGVQVGQVRFILLGLGLMLLMIFRPQGIFGDKRELALDV